MEDLVKHLNYRIEALQKELQHKENRLKKAKILISDLYNHINNN